MQSAQASARESVTPWRKPRELEGTSRPGLESPAALR
jgi:hypothetical protein